MQMQIKNIFKKCIDVVLTVLLLFVSIAMTAICGISMSIYAVPSMYGKINLMLARKMHLAMSYWSFILIGIHIGFHIKAMTAKLADKMKIIFTIISAVISSIGLWIFLKNGIPNYVFFKTHFAFLDYEKSKSFIILEDLAMLMFWVFAGSQLSELLQKSKEKKFFVKPLIWLGVAMITGIILNFAIGRSTDNLGVDTADGQTSVQSVMSITFLNFLKK